MNKNEFFIEFKKLCDYYNNKTYENKEITRFYYEKVKGLNVNQFKEKCKDIINNCVFMPKVAEFNTTIGHQARHYTEEFLNEFYEV